MEVGAIGVSRAKGPAIQIAWAKAISVGPGNSYQNDWTFGPESQVSVRAAIFGMLDWMTSIGWNSAGSFNYDDASRIKNIRVDSGDNSRPFSFCACS